MKLFLDENISPLHARELRAKGYDALAVVEAGLSGASDEIILEFAVREDRILVTLDADFANALRFPAEHTLGWCAFASIRQSSTQSGILFTGRFSF